MFSQEKENARLCEALKRLPSAQRPDNSHTFTDAAVRSQVHNPPPVYDIAPADQVNPDPFQVDGASARQCSQRAKHGKRIPRLVKLTSIRDEKPSLAAFFITSAPLTISRIDPVPLAFIEPIWDCDESFQAARLDASRAMYLCVLQ